MFETATFLDLMDALVRKCHQMSKDKGFWDEGERVFHSSGMSAEDDLPTTSETRVKTAPWNFGEKIALVHSELSEALEAHRKGNPPSEKITDTDGKPYGLVAEEMADVVIRVCDLCGKLGIDLGRAILAKTEYNAKRPHKHGKRY
jgi:NTP pyrophosphatase (non-canonical NTP hydrolase)